MYVESVCVRASVGTKVYKAVSLSESMEKVKNHYKMTPVNIESKWLCDLYIYKYIWDLCQHE